jgi:hypothetical protein
VKAFKFSFRSFPKIFFSNSCFVSTTNFPGSATAKWISGMWVAPTWQKYSPRPSFLLEQALQKHLVATYDFTLLT